MTSLREGAWWQVEFMGVGQILLCDSIYWYGGMGQSQKNELH